VSEVTRVDRVARRTTLGAAALAAIIGVGGALEVAPEHRPITATGGVAITLLLTSLGCSPVAALLSARLPVLAVALRRTRRWLGIATAVAALVHAAFGAYGYLGNIGLEALEAIVATAWLRHGALALALLLALGLTSFPAITRLLRVRAWSALHRAVYVAAVLAGLHATAAPFGDVGGGLFALAVVFVLLVGRPIALALASRRRQADAPDP
jgi:sulfoxide reductase heme-binding subunit YedZ